MRKKSGFTLVELLIVISIIGVLTVLTLIGLRAIRGKALDVQRKSDIMAMARSITSHAAENGEKVPISNNGAGGEELITSATTSAGGVLASLSDIPTNRGMKDSAQYYTYQSDDGNRYKVCGYLSDSSYYCVVGGSPIASIGNPPSGGDLNPIIIPKPDPDNPKTPDNDNNPLADITKPFWVYPTFSNDVTWRSTVGPITYITNNNGDNTVNVNAVWDRAFDAGGPVHYKLTYWEKNSQTKQTIDNLQSTYTTISNLDQTKDYTFQISAIDHANNELVAPTRDLLLSRSEIDPLSCTQFNPAFYIDPTSSYFSSPTPPIMLHHYQCGPLAPGAISYVYEYLKQGSTDWIPVLSHGDDTPPDYLYLADGNYLFRARGVLNTGKSDTMKNFKELEYSFTINNGKTDIEPPFFTYTPDHGTPIQLTNIGDKSYAVSWPKAVDNVSLSHYHIKITQGSNTIMETDTLTPSTIASNLNPGQSYHFLIQAVDTAGNSTPTMVHKTYKASDETYRNYERLSGVPISIIDDLTAPTN